MFPRRTMFLLKLLPICVLLPVLYLVTVSIIRPPAADPDSDFLHRYMDGGKTPAVVPLEVIRKTTTRANEEEKVLNSKAFSGIEVTSVILIQVHNRAEYLAALIDSLSKVAGVNSSILIFSHDVFDPRINDLVTSITFARVNQIFYPFSMQLFPNSFPGPDPRDCPRDRDPIEARKSRCLNADFPDSYGHYREARFTQTKHHWFWKANHVLSHMRLTQELGAEVPFVFLEEDYFLAPDVLHFLHLMLRFKEISCKDCLLLTLGSYAKSVSFPRNGDRVEVKKWFSSRHNMGLVVTRDSWSKITACAETFCTFDDYNWDWSLQQVSLSCMKSPMRTLVASAPRVFHLGVCGVHHRAKDCTDTTGVRQKVTSLINSSSQYLFPKTLRLGQTGNRNTKVPKANGGWSDRRDHILCLSHLDHSMRLPGHSLNPDLKSVSRTPD